MYGRAASAWRACPGLARALTRPHPPSRAAAGAIFARALAGRSQPNVTSKIIINTKPMNSPAVAIFSFPLACVSGMIS